MKNGQKKLSKGLLIALAGFPQISETIYTPALPNVASSLAASAYRVELTLSIYFVGFALGVLLWGTVSDGIGRRYAMLMGIGVYGAATLMCGNASHVEALLGWRFLQAFGASVGSVITQTILRDAYEGAERTQLFSVLSGALAFSPAIGPLCGGFISEYFGWRANFWVLAVLALVLAGWTFCSLAETRLLHVKRLTRFQMRRLLIEMMQSRLLWGNILLIGATNGLLFGFYQEAPFVFIEQMGMKPSHYGFFGLLVAVATLLSGWLSYRLSSCFSAVVFIRFGAWCVLAGGFLFTGLVLSGFFALTTGEILFVSSALFIIFLGIGLIIPNSLSNALRDFQTNMGTAGSIFGGCYYCVVAACTWLLSGLHNGTALPLPLYMVFLGFVLIVGCRMVHAERKVEG